MILFIRSRPPIWNVVIMFGDLKTQIRICIYRLVLVDLFLADAYGTGAVSHERQ